MYFLCDLACFGEHDRKFFLQYYQNLAFEDVELQEMGAYNFPVFIVNIGCCFDI